MPASSFSTQVSEAVYLAAMLMLLAILAQPVHALYAGSQQKSALQIASEVGGVVDALGPGMSSVLVLEANPVALCSVSFQGENIVASFGGYSATYHARFELPQATLRPGATYIVRMQANGLVELQVRHE